MLPQQSTTAPTENSSSARQIPALERLLSACSWRVDTPQDDGGADGSGGTAHGQGGSGFFLSKGAPGAGAGKVATFAGPEDESYDCDENKVQGEEEVIHARRDIVIYRHARPVAPPGPLLSSEKRNSHHAQSSRSNGNYTFAAEEDKAPVKEEIKGLSSGSNGSNGSSGSTTSGEQGEARSCSRERGGLMAIWVSNNDNSLHGDTSPAVAQPGRTGREVAASSLPWTPRGGGGGIAVKYEALIPAGGEAGAATMAAAMILIRSPPRLIRYRKNPNGSVIVSGAGRATVAGLKRPKHGLGIRQAESDKKSHQYSRAASDAAIAAAAAVAAFSDSSDDVDDANNGLPVAHHQDREEGQNDEERRQRQLREDGRDYHHVSRANGGADVCRGPLVKNNCTFDISSDRCRASTGKRKILFLRSLSLGVSGGSARGEAVGKLKGVLEPMPKTSGNPAVRRKNSIEEHVSDLAAEAPRLPVRSCSSSIGGEDYPKDAPIDGGGGGSKGKQGSLHAAIAAAAAAAAAFSESSDDNDDANIALRVALHKKMEETRKEERRQRQLREDDQDHHHRPLSNGGSGYCRGTRGKDDCTFDVSVDRCKASTGKGKKTLLRSLSLGGSRGSAGRKSAGRKSAGRKVVDKLKGILEPIPKASRPPAVRHRSRIEEHMADLAAEAYQSPGRSPSSSFSGEVSPKHAPRDRGRGGDKVKQRTSSPKGPPGFRPRGSRSRGWSGESGGYMKLH